MSFVDWYKDFDPLFFFDEDGQGKRQYRALLEEHDVALDDILALPFGGEGIEELPEAFWTALHPLVRSEEKHSLLLRKSYLEPISPLLREETIFAATGRELHGSQRDYLCGRVLSHVARLLLPRRYACLDDPFVLGGSPTETEHEAHRRRKIMQGHKLQNTVCAAFARHYVGYASTRAIDESLDERYPFLSIVGKGDRDHVFTFWTLAPYVHHALTQTGIHPYQSIATVVGWVSHTTVEYGKRSPVRPCPQPVLDHTDFSLFGLGWGMREVAVLNPLGYDERMPTHLCARLLGKHVAGKLYAES
jgi:hypothetical protein